MKQSPTSARQKLEKKTLSPALTLTEAVGHVINKELAPWTPGAIIMRRHDTGVYLQPEPRSRRDLGGDPFRFSHARLAEQEHVYWLILSRQWEPENNAPWIEIMSMGDMQHMRRGWIRVSTPSPQWIFVSHDRDEF